MPDWKKLIEGEIALAQQSRQQGNKPGKPGKANVGLEAHVPVGQTVDANFPILDLGIPPEINKTNWTLRVFGLVDRELNPGRDDSQQQPPSLMFPIFIASRCMHTTKKLIHSRNSIFLTD